jgi:hypothetical protein
LVVGSSPTRPTNPARVLRYKAPADDLRCLVRAVIFGAIHQAPDNARTTMRSRTIWMTLPVAVVAAATIGIASQTTPYDQNLIRLEANERLAPIDPAMTKEPIETQALLLAYADNKTLLFKTSIALSKYPRQTRELLGLYGDEPAFREALEVYGEAAMPVVKYFVDHDVLSLRLREMADNTISKGGKMLNKGWNSLKGTPSADAASPPSAPGSKLGSTSRGRYAVRLINDEGYQFLGQFVVDQTGAAKWNQTNRLTQDVAALVTGDLGKLESKRDLNEQIGAADVFFAAMDVIPFAVSLKLLRIGKLASAEGKELTVATRTRLLAPDLIPKSTLLRKAGKYGVMAATTFVIIRHPTLINSLLSEAASLLGFPAWLLQWVFWFVLIFAATYPFLWILKNTAKAILFALSLIEVPRTGLSAAAVRS